jgi:type IV pilus assembly protein PilA
MTKLLNLRKREGFTLIELMIVVAIIGILAAIAIPNFLRFQLRSKAGEGKVNLAAIRTAEEGYFAEFSTYVNASVLSPVDVGVLDVAKKNWTDRSGFNEMGWGPEGDVYYTYGVTVGPSGGPPFDHYTAEAFSDIDDNDVINVWGYVKPNAAGTALDGGFADSACTTAGTYDAQSGGNVLQTVGPCAAGHGQSIF